MEALVASFLETVRSLAEDGDVSPAPLVYMSDDGSVHLEMVIGNTHVTLSRARRAMRLESTSIVAFGFDRWTLPEQGTAKGNVFTYAVLCRCRPPVYGIIEYDKGDVSEPRQGPEIGFWHDNMSERMPQLLPEITAFCRCGPTAPSPTTGTRSGPISTSRTATSPTKRFAASCSALLAVPMCEGWAGARVWDPWAAKHGSVLEWSPLSAAMNDALVRYDDGSECWVSTHALHVDGPPRQTRTDAISRADHESRELLESIRSALVLEVGRRSWDGCEFGKGILGMALDKATGRATA